MDLLKVAGHRHLPLSKRDKKRALHLYLSVSLSDFHVGWVRACGFSYEPLTLMIGSTETLSFLVKTVVSHHSHVYSEMFGHLRSSWAKTCGWWWVVVPHAMLVAPAVTGLSVAHLVATRRGAQ